MASLARSLVRGVYALAVVTAVCAPALAMTVSVSEFSLVGQPGANLVLEFAVLNDEAQSFRVELAACDWDTAPSGITSLSAPGTVARSCATWLSLTAPPAVLPPGGEAAVSCQVRVPVGVAGTYWAGLLLTVGAVDGPSGPVGRGTSDEGIRVSREFLVKVYVTCLPATRAAAVTHVAVRGLSPLTVELVVANRGEERIEDIVGSLSVQAPSGATLAETSLPQFAILPDHAASVVVEAPWSLIDPGLFLVRAVVDFGGDYLVAGQVVVRISELALLPLGVSSMTPRDLDGDGLFEDVDGDGDVDAADVELLAASLDLAAVQRNARAFDFDNDGRLSPADIEALRRRVS